MLDPIFSRHGEVPQTPTNAEREQAWRNSFNPHRQDEAAASRGALADGDFSPYGGGGVESRHAQSAGSAAPECGSDSVRVAPQLNRVTPSRSSALPAPTQSPLKDEQPRRAASPIPGTYTHTPGA